MKLQIDNLDGFGPRDYTSSIDGSRSPQVIRKLNQPSEMRFSLLADSANFVVPVSGARVTLGMTNGQDVFTGYLMSSPVFEYLGWGERGPVYRYDLIAQSDEALLDEKTLPDRCPFLDRSAGNALRQLTEDLLPGAFDTSAAQDLDILAWYASNPRKKWSQEAAEIAVQSRASYRTMNGALIFAPLGANVYALNETDAGFCPLGLKLQPVNGLINDITVIGQSEPQAYVRDYFVGDGLTLKFYLSQTPFTKTNLTVFDEEYTSPTLDPTLWNLNDPAHVISVSGGLLQIRGGTGVDGVTTVQFAEKTELGGALVMQHGDVMFSAASSGVLGGLYPGAVSIAGCLAGFKITPSGAQSNIQALINGASAGAALATIAGHHYFLTTRLYSQEIYRRQEIFHSSAHPAGSGIGGAEVGANVRIVLEVHDIDPANPATQVSPSTVLYDDVISNAPDFCTYALVNAANLQCAIAFTRLIQAVDTEVRSALPGLAYVTELVGSLEEGAECEVTSSGALEFYPQFAPAANELIEVHYRSLGRALARITNPASIVAQQRGIDNGLYGAVRHLKEPPARTAADCEMAALALLDDTTGPAWTGEYDVWSDFLPGTAPDIFPGDELNLNVPSRSAVFSSIVTAVEITLKNLDGEHFAYKIMFANDAAKALAFEFQGTGIANLPQVNQFTNAEVGTTYVADLTAAEITLVSSTTVTVDAGLAPISGGGIEVRWSDSGWGPGNDRNLVGRFTSETFTVPRLSRVQNCYLRQYDASVPPKYSRFTAALHLDYPL
jgi:hypothetical protein